jgi:hypothetical protein
MVTLDEQFVSISYGLTCSFELPVALAYLNLPSGELLVLA